MPNSVTAHVCVQVADTQKHADMAANLAVVDYDMENVEAPILTVEEAVRRCSFYEVPSFISQKQVGDFSRGMEEADHKILSAEVLFIYLLYNFLFFYFMLMFSELLNPD